jgi:hypothetical protein
MSTKGLTNRPFTLREIYNAVRDVNGGSDINIFTGERYVNKNGTVLEPKKAKERQEGAIRSFIEEHSADSRQHWVKANVVHRNSPFENLFSNESLRIRNQLSNWQMRRYVDNDVIETFPSRSGLWEFKPGAGQPTHEQFTLMESKNERKGMCRQANKSHGKTIMSAKIISTRV